MRAAAPDARMAAAVGNFIESAINPERCAADVLPLNGLQRAFERLGAPEGFGASKS